MNLKKEKNGRSVSDVVNRKAFHDSFERATISKNVYESAYKAIASILEIADGKDNEYMEGFDARTGELIVNNTGRDAAFGTWTAFNGAEMAEVMGHSENRIVLMHNHPNSTSPSFQDLITASTNIVHGSFVVGHDGSIWYLESNENAASSLMIAKEDFKSLDYEEEFARAKAVEYAIKIQKRIPGFVWRRVDGQA